MKAKLIDADVRVGGTLSTDDGMAITDLRGNPVDAGKVPVIQGDGTVEAQSLGSIGITLDRSAIVQTTAALADLAEESDTVELGKSFLLLRVVADRPCRVRLYNTAAARTADGARAAGIEAVQGVGLIAELIFALAGTIIMSPAAIGANLETVPTDDISYLIQNTSGSTHTVAVTFTRLLLE